MLLPKLKCWTWIRCVSQGTKCSHQQMLINLVLFPGLQSLKKWITFQQPSESKISELLQVHQEYHQCIQCSFHLISPSATIIELTATKSPVAQLTVKKVKDLRSFIQKERMKNQICWSKPNTLHLRSSNWSSQKFHPRAVLVALGGCWLAGWAVSSPSWKMKNELKGNGTMGDLKVMPQPLGHSSLHKANITTRVSEEAHTPLPRSLLLLAATFILLQHTTNHQEICSLIFLCQCWHGQGVLHRGVRRGGRIQPHGASRRCDHRLGADAHLHTATAALSHHLPLLLRWRSTYRTVSPLMGEAWLLLWRIKDVRGEGCWRKQEGKALAPDFSS